MKPGRTKSELLEELKASSIQRELGTPADTFPRPGQELTTEPHTWRLSINVSLKTEAPKLQPIQKSGCLFRK